MFSILLIRHGSTDLMSERLCGRTPGIQLNAEGERQASVVGRALRENVKLGAVYTSPLERAVETAERIASAQNLPVVVKDELNELDFGSWQGLTFAELHQRSEWHSYNRRRSLERAPGGESLAEVQARAWRCLWEIMMAHGNETAAAVSHGDVIRALLLLVLGMPLDYVLRVEVGPASVTEIRFEGGGQPTVVYLNRRWE
jgi:broad specificity phosphatase PhoE